MSGNRDKTIEQVTISKLDDRDRLVKSYIIQPKTIMEADESASQKQEAKRDISIPESKTQLVLASRPEPSFHRYLDLPPALLALVAIFWDQKDLHQCNRALVGFYNHYFRILSPAAPGDGATVVTYQPMGAFLHRQFKVVPREARLLQAVVDADYSRAQAAVDQDLSLMFKPVNFKYRDGNSECISPLKYALKVYDTYMWKLFYEKIKENPKQVAEFLKQALEQIRNLDLTPLFAVYEEYEKQYQRWLRGALLTSDELVTDKELDAAWVKLGTAQQLILPVHMLKEFSRKGDTWSADSAFDVTAMPPPSNCQIYDYHARAWRALSSIISDRGWGPLFSLVRGGPTPRPGAAPAPSLFSMFSENANGDLAIFRRLLKVRKVELVKQISLLSQNSHTSPELQTQHLSSASRVVP